MTTAIKKGERHAQSDYICHGRRRAAGFCSQLFTGPVRSNNVYWELQLLLGAGQTSRTVQWTVRVGLPRVLAKRDSARPLQPVQSPARAGRAALTAVAARPSVGPAKTDRGPNPRQRESEKAQAERKD